jgi:FlaA1/EpsC-like NDP-sugar epimerase
VWEWVALIHLPRLRDVASRRSVVIVLDALATAASLQGALLLRFEGHAVQPWGEVARRALPLLIAVRVLTVLFARLHLWSFRMAGLTEALRLGSANLVGTGAFLFLFPLISKLPLPRSVVALEFFLTTTIMAAMRFSPRLALGWYSEQKRALSGMMQRTLIAGAGGAGDLLLRDLLRSPDHRYQVIGFVDDDRAKIGTSLGGRPVLGRLDDLPDLIARHQVAMVMLAIPRLPAARIREVLNLCSRQKASFKIIPTSFTALDGRLSATMLHDLSPDDLLPRDEVAFDHGEIRAMVQARRILVTGGGGSIGGEIARQVAEHGCSLLVLVDLYENEMYLKARQLRDQYPQVDIRTEVGDIRDAARMRRLGEQYRPHHVFHAAAHKHVPLMEEAPDEAVKNNVVGTLNVARMADACGAERMVFISTDKAVRPTSVMGASKRLGELVVRDIARESRTKMTAVRFGNVLGSAGSVVPIFKQQIERGGPVTVTHPDCSRYFMTISEAVGLVLLAGLGGFGELCVLDMGEPIKIADLAANMITMAGYIPGQEIAIVFTGLRPGEKLHEELLTEEEERTHSVRDRIRVAHGRTPPPDLFHRVEELARLADAGDRSGVVRMLGDLVPSYRVTPNDSRALADVADNPMGPLGGSRKIAEA